MGMGQKGQVLLTWGQQSGAPQSQGPSGTGEACSPNGDRRGFSQDGKFIFGGGQGPWSAGSCLGWGRAVMQPGCSLYPTLQHQPLRRARAGVSPGISPFTVKSVPATTNRTGPLGPAAKPQWGKKRPMGLHALASPHSMAIPTPCTDLHWGSLLRTALGMARACGFQARSESPQRCFRGTHCSMD